MEAKLLDQVISDIADLIKKFEEFRNTCKDRDFFNLDITERSSLRTQAVSMIERIAPGCVYQKQADVIIEKGEHDWNVLHQLQGILEALLKDLKDGSFVPIADSLGSLDVIADICQRFHRAVLALRSRPRSREPITVNDEYDVQYLLQSFLALAFHDIRPEEPTPSSGGKSSRIDFLLINEQIGVETKMTRDNLRDSEIGKELKIDIIDYQSHPQCKALVCFVYDPNHRISNPTALESDLSRQYNAFQVRVIVAPKP